MGGGCMGVDMSDRTANWLSVLTVLIAAIAVATVLALSVGPAFAKETADYRPLEMIEKAGRLVPGDISGVVELNENGEWRFMLERFPTRPTLRERAQLGKPVGRSKPCLPTGACDSLSECEAELDTICSNAKHGGVDPKTVEITKHANDDGKTCSGDCKQNGAVAFIDCEAPVTDSSGGR